MGFILWIIFGILSAVGFFLLFHLNYALKRFSNTIG